MIPFPKMAFGKRIIQKSFSVHRQQIQLMQVDHLTSCLKKFSSTYSKNFQISFLSTVLYLKQISGKLKGTREKTRTQEQSQRHAAKGLHEDGEGAGREALWGWLRSLGLVSLEKGG